MAEPAEGTVHMNMYARDQDGTTMPQVETGKTLMMNLISESEKNLKQMLVILPNRCGSN